MTESQAVAVRRAGPGDITELIRLRAVMLGSVDRTDVPVDAEWADRCREELESGLTGHRLAAFVVDAPQAPGLAACGVGVVDVRLPAPGRLSGRVGHVSSMCTDPRWRRRGYARAVLDAVVAWLQEQGCGRVELSASDEGLPLYRERGFVDAPNPSLRRPL